MKIKLKPIEERFKDWKNWTLKYYSDEDLEQFRKMVKEENKSVLIFLLLVTLFITFIYTSFLLLTDKWTVKLYSAMHCEDPYTKTYDRSTAYFWYEKGYELYCERWNKDTLMYYEYERWFWWLGLFGGKKYYDTSFDIWMWTYVINNWWLFNLFEPVLKDAVKDNTREGYIAYSFNSTIPVYIKKNN